ncbi:MAG TPA: hypothetical protein VF434_00325 [Promineifilum sp.]
MNRNKRVVLFLIACLVLLFVAGDHPLVEHWGDIAQSGFGDFGSKWIHTDTSGVRYGLWGESASADARGVFGHATTTNGSGLAIGVYGETDSPTGRGVHGYASNGTGTSFGVTGATFSTDPLSAGVYGFNNQATTGSTRGVRGLVRSTYGYGVIGHLAPTGAGEAAGVHGSNAATSGQGAGIEGSNVSPNGWAGHFYSNGNGVRIYANPGKVGLVVNAGTKNASVPTSDGDRLLYSEESTEVWFSDYGFGQLQGGYALVKIDPVFAETVNLAKPYHVFLQAYGDTELYVTKRTADSFEVWATGESANKDVEFSYRIVGKRLGFEDHRLEFAPWVTEEHPYYVQPPIPEPGPLNNEPEGVN